MRRVIVLVCMVSWVTAIPSYGADLPAWTQITQKLKETSEKLKTNRTELDQKKRGSKDSDLQVVTQTAEAASVVQNYLYTLSVLIDFKASHPLESQARHTLLDWIEQVKPSLDEQISLIRNAETVRVQAGGVKSLVKRIRELSEESLGLMEDVEAYFKKAEETESWRPPAYMYDL